MDGWMNGQMGKWTGDVNGWMILCMDKWMDRWKDG